jgi:hypothetical protein
MKRYEMSFNSAFGEYMNEHPGGDYITYEDHVEATSELGIKNVRLMLEKMELMSMLEDAEACNAIRNRG